MRELLLQMFMGEKFGRDSIWEHHLASQLWQTELTMSAVLDEVGATLRDVLNWEVGSRIVLNTQPDGLVELRSGDETMFRGRMGQRKGHIAVRIDQAQLKRQEVRR